uniref:Malonyl-CoA:ACP transacylase (MAT) domain-containing protein n=1 Tax=Octactis speculum TaxID=3111310 RepID=A0A7S2FI54_9STRA|mmetsp:Transcript_22813/g.31189  ORF Transcript_22813/g.31189 Transcript_22813/m.31189 type:complete len:645 (+) Transcript_22813:54-1988(+)
MCLPGDYRSGGYLQGNPAKSCTRAKPTGEWIHEGEGVLLDSRITVELGFDETSSPEVKKAVDCCGGWLTTELLRRIGFSGWGSKRREGQLYEQVRDLENSENGESCNYLEEGQFTFREEGVELSEYSNTKGMPQKRGGIGVNIVTGGKELISGVFNKIANQKKTSKGYVKLEVDIEDGLLADFNGDEEDVVKAITTKRLCMLFLRASSTETLPNAAEAVLQLPGTWSRRGGITLNDRIHTRGGVVCAVVAEGEAQLRNQLTLFSQHRAQVGRESECGVISKPLPNDQRQQTQKRRVVVCFGGESHYLGMGRALYERNHTFRDALDACDAVLREETGLCVIDALYREPSSSDQKPLDDVKMANMSVFAVQFALFQVVTKDLGIEPVAVLGYSIGELAAACASGAMNLRQTARLFRATSYSNFNHEAGGRMGLVAGPCRRELEEILTTTGDASVVVTAEYSACTFMVAGPIRHLELVTAALQRCGHSIRIMPTPFAYHAPLHRVDTDASAARIPPLTHDPVVPLVSCALGGFVTATGKEGGQCPAHSLEFIYYKPTLLRSALDAVKGLGVDLLLDLSVKADLACYYNIWQAEGDPERSLRMVPSLRGTGDSSLQFQQAAAELFLLGAAVEPSMLNLVGPVVSTVQD